MNSERRGGGIERGGGEGENEKEAVEGFHDGLSWIDAEKPLMNAEGR